MTHPQPTPAPDSAKVEAAIASVEKCLAFQTTNWPGQAVSAPEEDLRTLLAHVAAQAEALAQRPTDAGERERVARILSGAPFPSKRSYAKADEVLAILARPDAETVAGLVTNGTDSFVTMMRTDAETWARNGATLAPLGPVDSTPSALIKAGEVSEEMVERGAEGLWRCAFSRALGKARSISWDEVSPSEQEAYRADARGTLTAALKGGSDVG